MFKITPEMRMWAAEAEHKPWITIRSSDYLEIFVALSNAGLASGLSNADWGAALDWSYDTGYEQGKIDALRNLDASYEAGYKKAQEDSKSKVETQSEREVYSSGFREGYRAGKDSVEPAPVFGPGE